MEHDSLRQIRNCFYVGLYQQCIDEVAQHSTPESQLYADIFAHRAQVFTDPKAAIARIHPNASTALQAIKEFARYRVSVDDHERSTIIDTLSEWKQHEMTGNDLTLTLILATLLINERRYKEALPLVVNDAESLEKLSLCVITYLSIDRADLANKSLKAMVDLDDDDVLTQLSTAWCLLLTANSTVIDNQSYQSKILEAESIVQGLSETFPLSPSLLTMLALCELMKRNYTDSFRLLRQAKDVSKANNLVLSEEILFNSIVSVQHTGSAKSEELIAAIKSELKGDSEWTSVQKKREEEFNRQAANYKWTQ